MSSAIAVDLKSVPQSVMDAHNRTLLHSIAAFFDDADNFAKYAKWHQEKYGCPPKEKFEGSATR